VLVDLTLSEKLRVLRRRVEQIESWDGSQLRSRVGTGVAALDALFPGGGLRRGTLVELLSARDGGAAWTLALALARRACQESQCLVVVDQQRWFYPPGACALGIDLDRCLVVRPAHAQDALAAMCQSLRSAAVGGVISGIARVGAVDYQRLKTAAEHGGAIGFLVRPAEAAVLSTGASARLLISPIATRESSLRRLKVEVLRGRGRGQVLILEMDDETVNVRLPAGVADPAAASRAAQASS
jgi:hypothetical protein